MRLLSFIFTLATLALAHAQNWAARHGLTSDDYQTTFNSLTSQGYRLTYISGYTFQGSPRYAAIWEEKSGPDYVARHGMSAASYQSEMDSLAAQGYRPVLVNGYDVGGVPQYVAIWEKKGGGALVARHALSTAQYQETYASLTKAGYKLLHVSGYSGGGTTLYAAIWEQIPADTTVWASHSGMSSSFYQGMFELYAADGYRPLLVGGHAVGNTDLYDAIWDKSTAQNWIARHGMTSEGYQTEVNTWVAQGYKLTVVSGYTVGGQDRYAAIWYK
jgi:Bacterial tandem repeat domain 1